MIVTWNFIALLVGYGILMLIFPSLNNGWVLLLPLCLWGADWLLTVKEPRLTAERDFPKPTYHHGEYEVILTITNPMPRKVRVLIKDEPPFETEIQSPCRKNLTIPAFQRATLAYRLTTPKRGAFGFGKINLRYSGRLGLFVKTLAIAADQILEVYPDLSRIGDYRFHQLNTSETSGEHRRRLHSMTGEFAQLREFVSGDDLRKIDWKVTAHFGKPIVKEYEPERDQNVFLALDTGRMLFDQLEMHHNRMDYILDSILLLAYNILEHGDMVGMLSFNAEVTRYVPLGKNQHHLQLLIDQCYNVQAALIESDYREAFAFLQNRLTKRSLIFVYTDITDPESSRDLFDYLAILSRHHLVVCVLLKEDYLNQLTRRPISDEKSAYLKGVAFELQKGRRQLIQMLNLRRISVLEVDPTHIAQAVTEHYHYLKNKGLF